MASLASAQSSKTRHRSSHVIDFSWAPHQRTRRPAFIRSGNGPEFVSAAILRWLTENGINTAHIAPGKPWENGSDESLNGRFRDECLNQEWFRNRREARAIVEAWRQHYNEVRPHSSLGYLTPNELRTASSPSKIGEAAL
jgi:putative transposase